MTLKIRKLARQFPVIAIVGPRQSGKTTLAQATFEKHAYINLENPNLRKLALEDPLAFIDGHATKSGIIIDEIQEVPELLSYLQPLVDEKPRPGFFILTGSQNFLVNQAITQTLAGRVAIFTLLPLSIDELAHADLLPSHVEQVLFKGLYPRMWTQRISAVDWYPHYLRTYIERDVRQLKNITDLATFVRFVGLCAGRIGQLISFNELASDCGISVPTAKAWLSVLEACYIIFLLQPHHKNFSKRLIKSPKLYFYDTGLACNVLGIESTEQLATHYLRGGLMESLVITELNKTRYNQGFLPRTYFWRDRYGHEVDCLVEQANKLIPIEIKASTSLSADFFQGIDYWRGLAGTQAGNSFAVYAGDKNYKSKAGSIVSWKKIDAILQKSPPR